MALIFLSLGALVLYGTGEAFSESAAGFAGQLINLYTSALGPWAWWIIAIAALTTMFSTTLTVFDAYPRVMQHIMKASDIGNGQSGRTWYVFWLLTLGTGALVILSSFGGSMKSLITFTTVMSFLTAPLLAYMNYRVVTDKHLAKKDQPGKWLRILSWLGLIFLLSFSLLYIVWQVL
jgi:Mn2+/Fe2+ NRAMP family transporter